MDLSGVIFVVLALAWAGFLIPKLLRHHDEVARTRAVDRFSAATRVLARREPVDGTRARLVVTRRTTARVEMPASPVTPVTAAQRRAARAAARRRRRVLVVLTLALVAVGVAVGLAALPVWAVAVPAGMALGYLVLCRVLVRRERRRSTRGTVTSSPRASVEVTESVESTAVVAEETAPPQTRDAQGFVQVSEQEDTVTLRAEDLQAASLWDPLPITLPTYVGKPKARRTVRTIDLSAPDVSSSGRDAADSRLAAAAASDEQAPEPRRAVGS